MRNAVIIFAMLVLPFALGLYGLGYVRFFAPKQENVRPEGFEQTKSYQHGVAQDLGKYYGEYQNASEEEKAVIASVVRTRFAEFDASDLHSPELRQFLISTRGY